MNVIQWMSPIAWQHVNLIGRFEFSPAVCQLDIDALAACYADPACWKKVLLAGDDDVLPA